MEGLLCIVRKVPSAMVVGVISFLLALRRKKFDLKSIVIVLVPTAIVFFAPQLWKPRTWKLKRFLLPVGDSGYRVFDAFGQQTVFSINPIRFLRSRKQGLVTMNCTRVIVQEVIESRLPEPTMLSRILDRFIFYVGLHYHCPVVVADVDSIHGQLREVHGEYFTTTLQLEFDDCSITSGAGDVSVCIGKLQHPLTVEWKADTVLMKLAALRGDVRLYDMQCKDVSLMEMTISRADELCVTAMQTELCLLVSGEVFGNVSLSNARVCWSDAVRVFVPTLSVDCIGHHTGKCSLTLSFAHDSARLSYKNRQCHIAFPTVTASIQAGQEQTVSIPDLSLRPGIVIIGDGTVSMTAPQLTASIDINDTYKISQCSLTDVCFAQADTETVFTCDAMEVSVQAKEQGHVTVVFSPSSCRYSGDWLRLQVQRISVNGLLDGVIIDHGMISNMTATVMGAVVSAECTDSMLIASLQHDPDRYLICAIDKISTTANCTTRALHLQAQHVTLSIPPGPEPWTTSKQPMGTVLDVDTVSLHTVMGEHIIPRESQSPIVLTHSPHSSASPNTIDTIETIDTEHSDGTATDIEQQHNGSDESNGHVIIPAADTQESLSALGLGLVETEVAGSGILLNIIRLSQGAPRSINVNITDPEPEEPIESYPETADTGGRLILSASNIAEDVPMQRQHHTATEIHAIPAVTETSSVTAISTLLSIAQTKQLILSRLQVGKSQVELSPSRVQRLYPWAMKFSQSNETAAAFAGIPEWICFGMDGFDISSDEIAIRACTSQSETSCKFDAQVSFLSLPGSRIMTLDQCEWTKLVISSLSANLVSKNRYSVVVPSASLTNPSTPPSCDYMYDIGPFVMQCQGSPVIETSLQLRRKNFFAIRVISDWMAIPVVDCLRQWGTGAYTRVTGRRQGPYLEDIEALAMEIDRICLTNCTAVIQQLQQQLSWCKLL